MSKAGQIPATFQRLNRFKVPRSSLIFNFLVGIVVVLPLPGWNELVEFISTSAVLSFAFGPVALMVMRLQDPERFRPVRVPAAASFTTLAFILVGFIVYWTGWQTNWKIFLVALAGLFILLAMRVFKQGNAEPLQLKASAWLWPYYAGLAIMSYLGNYGDGLGVIPFGADLVILALFSVAIFWLAIRLRLAPETIARILAPSSDEIDPAAQTM